MSKTLKNIFLGTNIAAGLTLTIQFLCQSFGMTWAASFYEKNTFLRMQYERYSDLKLGMAIFSIIFSCSLIFVAVILNSRRRHDSQDKFR
jgi:hypothetical protein